MTAPNQNKILRVQEGIPLHLESLCSSLDDIRDEFDSFSRYADLETDPDTMAFAQLCYSSLEHTNQATPPLSLNAFAFGHVVAQLCTRYDGTILLSNQHGDGETVPEGDFRDIMDSYLHQNYPAHMLAESYLSLPIEQQHVVERPTELYMAGAAMLLADLSNLKMNEIDALMASTQEE